MTISEYANLEERFKNDTLGKQIDYDGMFPGECYDLAQFWFVNYLKVPEGILGGCQYVNRMLYPPKINQLLEYFDEVPIGYMLKGDTVIWDWGGDLCHIAVYDHWDGQYCWFVTQNNPVPQITTLSILDTNGARAFRRKGIEPDKKVKLRGHIQDIGWTNWQDNVIGNVGMGKRLEAIQIDAPDYKIKAKAHIEGIGWVDYGEITKDTVIGTAGEARRLEALQIIADGLVYQVYVKDLGWSEITECGAKYMAGTEGYAKQIEAICIK